MKKTINYTIILAVTIILGCQGYSDREKDKKPNNESISSSHLGAWEMVYFQSICVDLYKLIILAPWSWPVYYFVLKC